MSKSKSTFGKVLTAARRAVTSITPLQRHALLIGVVVGFTADPYMGSIAGVYALARALERRLRTDMDGRTRLRSAVKAPLYTGAGFGSGWAVSAYTGVTLSVAEAARLIGILLGGA